MRFYSFFFALLCTGFLAKADVDSLNKTDFSRASEIATGETSTLHLHLSESGQAKIHRLNANSVGQKVAFHLGGKTYEWILRVRIAGDTIEAGPVSHAEAQKIETEVNSR